MLSSLRLAVMLLNRTYVVTSWNSTCQEIWGLREEEAVGQELFALDIGLPVEKLREPLGNLLGGRAPKRPYPSRPRKAVQVELEFHPLAGRNGEITGAVVVLQGTTERPAP